MIGQIFITLYGVILRPAKTNEKTTTYKWIFKILSKQTGTIWYIRPLHCLLLRISHNCGIGIVCCVAGYGSSTHVPHRNGILIL